MWRTSLSCSFFRCAFPYLFSQFFFSLPFSILLLSCFIPSPHPTPPHLVLCLSQRSNAVRAQPLHKMAELSELSWISVVSWSGRLCIQPEKMKRRKGKKTVVDALPEKVQKIAHSEKKKAKSKVVEEDVPADTANSFVRWGLLYKMIHLLGVGGGGTIKRLLKKAVESGCHSRIWGYSVDKQIELKCFGFVSRSH